MLLLHFPPASDWHYNVLVLCGNIWKWVKSIFRFFFSTRCSPIANFESAKISGRKQRLMLRSSSPHDFLAHLKISTWMEVFIVLKRKNENGKVALSQCKWNSFHEVNYHSGVALHRFYRIKSIITHHTTVTCNYQLTRIALAKVKRNEWNETCSKKKKK